MIRETGRIYGRVKNIAIDELRAAFAGLTYVHAALLFGSRCDVANSRIHHKSDYDFAVLFDKSVLCAWGHLARLRVDLAPLLGLPDEDFDIVDLEAATPQMLESIADFYEMLKGDKDEIRVLLDKLSAPLMRF